jgi:arabinogalactan endo-1,4-beta-galactosidase
MPVIPALFAAMSTLAAEDFIAGADFSHLGFFEDRGITYKSNGVATDALAILAGQGVNCVRLRLFTSSAAQAKADPYNATNNLDYNLPLAVRVKNAGMKFMLDFHYSDSWADPGKQNKPSAWTNLNFTQLVQKMHDYNSNCIAAFKVAGAMPEYVQVGNEITPGMLWPDGRVGGSYDTPAQWLQLRQLMNAAIQGIKDAAGAGPPKIMVHIDRGGDWGATQWFFDHLRQSPQPVEFDIIGESYYPYWHGTLDALRNCLTNAADRYDKPVVVAETDFPWANSTNIIGIPATTNGQVQYVVALAQIVKGVPGGRGAGIFWWATEYVQLAGYNFAGFDRRSFFNATGNVLPVAAAYGQLAAPIRLDASLTGAVLNLKWDVSGAGMTLTTSTDIASTDPWLPVTNTVQTTGIVSSITLPVKSSPGRFYRLQSN